MTLAAGTSLGHYEIIGKLGAGGMGEVWRARDPRLDRQVAIKVLPEGFADDPERHARFEREARVLASLSHPHIATLHALEHLDGQHVLVMELVEGQGLDDRIARGAVPLDEAIPIARQIAEALEAAHEHGIVHRDLKPANIKVRPDGAVKVLDFGLAKALDPAGSQAQSDPAHSPTLTAATQQGLILGTAAYMAPEQARGKAVDRRADIWAFGVVLFEMVTGVRLFTGELVTDVLANVLKHEIDWTRLPAGTPPEVRRLLHRCLERDPKNRLRDIGEARVVLSEHAAVEAPAPPPPRPAGPRWVVPALVLGAAAATAVVAFLVGRATSPTSVEDMRITGLTFRRGSVLTARFSPDGRAVVYGGAWDGAPLDVYTVRIDSRESRALGLAGADVLGISSRGELALSLRRRFTIGWESAGTLARMAPDGAAPREVMEGVQDADWSPDGADLAVVRDVGARRRLEFPLGKVLYETGGWISHARVSRDGRRVAFLDHPNRGDNQAAVKVADATGAVREVAPSAANGLAWSAAGDAVLFPTGQAIREATLGGRTRVVFRTMGGLFLHDVAAQGQVLVSRTTQQREIVVQSPREPRPRNLSWLDWSFPTAVSDDGGSVLFEEQNLVVAGDYTIFLRRTDGSPPVRLGEGRGLALSPDGRWVLATQRSGEPAELLLLPTGAGETRRVGAASVTAEAAAFLPDGARVVLGGHAPGEGGRLYVMGLDGAGLRPISPEGVTAYFCALVSPDGTLAFANGPDGALTLYPIAGGEPRRVPGTSLEDVPIRWAADGRSLFVQRRTGLPARVERVDIVTGVHEPWLELTPPDPAGVHGIGPIHLSSDGRTAVYSYRRKLDQLFVVEGLR